jgi:hypothetical protein
MIIFILFSFHYADAAIRHAAAACHFRRHYFASANVLLLHYLPFI